MSKIQELLEKAGILNEEDDVPLSGDQDPEEVAAEIEQVISDLEAVADDVAGLEPGGEDDVDQLLADTEEDDDSDPPMGDPGDDDKDAKIASLEARVAELEDQLSAASA